MNKIIKERRSIRKFQAGKPVSPEQIRALLEAAMLAPSAHNSRPWEFTVITKREILDELAAVHPYAKMCKTAAAAILVTAIPQTGKGEGFYPQDCGAATQNILLEAVSQGLGACCCGVYPKENVMADFHRIFDVQEPKIPFCLIALGVPDEDPHCRGFFEESKVTYIS